MRETGLTNNDWQTSTRQNTTKTQGSNVKHAQWSNFLPAAHQGKLKKQPLSRKMCGKKKTSERSFKSVKWNKSRKKKLSIFVHRAFWALPTATYSPVWLSIRQHLALTVWKHATEAHALWFDHCVDVTSSNMSGTFSRAVRRSRVFSLTSLVGELLFVIDQGLIIFKLEISL